MGQEHDDYGDSPPPRTLASKLVLVALVLIGLTAVGTAAWIGLLLLTGECSKYG
jgi:hypothetical protein